MAFLCFPFDFLVAVRQWMLLVFLVLQVASRQLPVAVVAAPVLPGAE